VLAVQKHLTLPLKTDGTVNTDGVFPMMAFGHLGHWAGLTFIVGLTAATFSSADSVLTTLTTSFCIDFLKFNPDEVESERHKTTRHWAHVLFAVAIMLSMLLISKLNNTAIITTILTVAGYTYGPLLGMFSFGILTKIKINESGVLAVCLISPFLTWLIDMYLPQITNGFQLGFLNLLVNGMLTFIGLWLLKTENQQVELATKA
jgi:Na+/proline symporter